MPSAQHETAPPPGTIGHGRVVPIHLQRMLPLPLQGHFLQAEALPEILAAKQQVETDDGESLP